ncbi:hypothetical protein TcBrA4_0110850 [Trypanosoma cruzi]|nr:hypothetical protein TcBrA4_0110850 [Trypanosoma cruzi]
MILRSGAGLAARWTEVSFADARESSDAVLKGCGGEWGPDTERFLRRRGAERTVDASDQKGPHGVLGRTRLCTLRSGAADGGVARSTLVSM